MPPSTPITAAVLTKVEQAFAPLEGVPAMDRLQAAMEKVRAVRQGDEPAAIDFAWSTRAPANLVAAAADWAGADLAALYKGRTCGGRDVGAFSPLLFRPMPLDGVRALDLIEAAPLAVIVVTPARPDEAERDRLRELAFQSRGLPLVLLAPESIPDDLSAELGGLMDLRQLQGVEALRETDLGATLAPTPPEALRGSAQTVTVRRLLVSAHCLVQRALRRCEGEALRARLPVAGQAAGDPFAACAAEVKDLGKLLSDHFTRRFANAAEAFASETLPDEELALSSDGHARKTLYTASGRWTTELRARVAQAAKTALEQAMEFVDRRMQSLGERVSVAATAAGRQRPPPMLKPSRAEMEDSVRKAVAAIEIEPFETSERTLLSFISRHNPLGVLQPLSPLILMPGLAPPGTFGTYDAGRVRQVVTAVIMGVGAIYYAVSALRAVPKRREALREDRVEAREMLHKRAIAAARKALADMGAQTSKLASQRSEPVKVWFEASGGKVSGTGFTGGFGPGLSGTAAANPYAAQLQAQHKALAARLKEVSDLLGTVH